MNGFGTYIQKTGYMNYVNLMPNGALRVSNLRMLFERAKQYEEASFKDFTILSIS